MNLLPVFYYKIGFFYFFINLAAVSLLCVGILNLWFFISNLLRLQPDKNIFIESIKAIIIVPFLIFPLHLGLSFTGLYREGLIIIQVSLLLFGLHGIIFRKFYKSVYGQLKNFSFLSALCAVTVALFIYWPFVMPFVEKFNGHYHEVANLIQQMWLKGYFPVLDPAYVTHDNSILVWPANFAYFLSIFSFPWIAVINIHPIFLMPGALAFLTWRLLRALCAKLNFSPAVGDMAFLLMAFSYYNSYDFSSITFDTFSPLLCVFFLMLMSALVLKREKTQVIFLILLLSFTFLIRKQLFLLFSGTVFFLFLLYIFKAIITRKRINIFGWSHIAVFLFLIPSLTWCGFIYARYGSPFYPHNTALTYKMFPVSIAKIDTEPMEDNGISNNTLRPKGPEEPSPSILDTIKNYKSLSGINYYIENFLPIHASKGGAVFIKNVFCGLSNSLLQVFGFFGFLVLVLRQKYRKYLWILLPVILGYVVIGVSHFLTYHKYPHYLGYIITFFSAAFYLFLLKDVFKTRWAFNLLGCVVFVFGIYSWSFNLWGHSYKDTALENLKFLWPYYKTPVDRLSRISNRERSGVVKEIEELTAAQKDVDTNGGRILYMDHEPGALIPSILNLDYIGDFYYFQNPRSKKIYEAKNKKELALAFGAYGMKYVYKPQRENPDFNYTLLLKLLDSYDGQCGSIVPIEEVLKVKRRR